MSPAVRGRSHDMSGAGRKTLASTEGGATKGGAGNRKGNPYSSAPSGEVVRRKTDASQKKKRPGARIDDEPHRHHMKGAGHTRTTRAGGRRSRRLGSRKG